MFSLENTKKSTPAASNLNLIYLFIFLAELSLPSISSCFLPSPTPSKEAADFFVGPFNRSNWAVKLLPTSKLPLFTAKSRSWPRARSDTYTPPASEAPFQSQVTARSNVSVPTAFLQWQLVVNIRRTSYSFTRCRGKLFAVLSRFLQSSV